MSVTFPEIRVGDPLRCEALTVFPLFTETNGSVAYALTDEAIKSKSLDQTTIITKELLLSVFGAQIIQMFAQLFSNFSGEQTMKRLLIPIALVIATLVVMITTAHASPRWPFYNGPRNGYFGPTYQAPRPLYYYYVHPNSYASQWQSPGLYPGYVQQYRYRSYYYPQYRHYHYGHYGY